MSQVYGPREPGAQPGKAAEVRAAAERIRAVADAAAVHHPGCWTEAPGGVYGAVSAPSGETTEDLRQAYGGALVGESMQPSVRAHVVTWQPATAYAASNLLDLIAQLLERDPGYMPGSCPAAAGVLARLILRGDSS